MLGLPPSTHINRPLPKRAIFERFKPRLEARRLFDGQVGRLTIVAEISPQTVNLAPTEEVAAIYAIHVGLKTADCDKRNIALLAQLIDQRMLFVMQYKEEAWMAVYKAGRVLLSEPAPMEHLTLSLGGLDLGAAWRNIVATVGAIDLGENDDIDDAIARKEQLEKLARRIDCLKKQARRETQPRRKWILVEEIKKLEIELKILE
ncbi:MAG: DUF4391 domain-containing protein [Mediterranea sp.]|jgi:hypothetical protein|nr:DUF4391 domain-containing protein [Mediterranea sp.]